MADTLGFTAPGPQAMPFRASDAMSLRAGAYRRELRSCHGRPLTANGFVNFCPSEHTLPMATMNISLPDQLRIFADEQVSQRGFGSSSEYMRELIRKDKDRQQLRTLLLAGAASRPTTAVDSNYFESLRDGVRRAAHATREA